MSNDKYSQRTTYVGTNLANEATQWVAFPVLALDGENDSIVISASRYDMAYLNPQDGYGQGVMPTKGVFLLKHRETSTNGTGSGNVSEPMSEVSND